MAYDYEKMKTAYNSLTKEQQKQVAEQMKDNAAFQQFAVDYTKERYGTGSSTPSTPKNNTVTETYRWQVSDGTSNMNSMSQTKAQDNSRNFQVGTGDVVDMPQQPQAKLWSVAAQDAATKLAKTWDAKSFSEQKYYLEKIPWLKEALAQKWITNKTQPEVTTTTKPKQTTPQTPKQQEWDYQDNSQARMDEIARNLNWFRQTNPELFQDPSTFYGFFIDWKGRSQDQIDYLWNYYDRVKKYSKYDNMPASALWEWLADGSIPQDYLDYIKWVDPQKYQEILSYKQDWEDRIKNESYLDDLTSMAWYESEESETPEYLDPVTYAKKMWYFVDEDGNWTDDNLYIKPTDEERQDVDRINEINARRMEIKNMQKNLLDDLVEQYPWVPKATLMGIVQDRTKDISREYDDLWVELVQLQGTVDYLQNERDMQSKARQGTIDNLSKAYWMYYQYSPWGLAELAQSKYAATNITLDQADSGNETQKQMALQNVLDWYYEKYWDIIQRSEQQVINDVIAYAKKNWIWLAQALQENFVKPLQSKPQFATMESAYSEPNLQIMWYNSDWKAVYGYWDSATKTFKPVSVWAGWIWWVWTSWETNAEPLNDFIDELLWEGLVIAPNWWSWGSKIRSWGCWTVVNDYLWSIWDNIKLAEANDIASYATSDTPAVWWIAYFNWTQSRATPETKKHGHVWIVVKDNGDTITVLESNTWTWLRYKNYKKSDVTGYYVPNAIKTSATWTTQYNDVFTKAGNSAFAGLWAVNRAAAEENLKAYLDDWDYSSAFEYITIMGKNSADSDTKSKISAAETAAIDLIAIRDALDAYIAAWWETWLLKWTLEKVANKLGKTTDPQLAALAVKISEAIQAYRKHITWAAFSKEEAEEYADLFPSIFANEEYNSAKLDWTLNSMVTRLNQLYGWLIWPYTYTKMLDAHEKATWRKYSVFEEQSNLYNYLKDNWYLNTDWSVKEAQDFAAYMQQQSQRKGKRF